MVSSCIVLGSFSFPYHCWGRFTRGTRVILVPIFATISMWTAGRYKGKSCMVILHVQIVSASSYVTSVLCNSYSIPNWFSGTAENLIAVLKDVNELSHSCIRDHLLSVLSKINFILVDNQTLGGKCLNFKEFIG